MKKSMDKTIKIGINGFGRIGRVLARQISEDSKLQIIAINDIVEDVDNLAYLFNYDSTYGPSESRMMVKEDGVYLNNAKIEFSSSFDIKNVEWDKIGVDVVIDSSGSNENTKSYINLKERGLITLVTSSPNEGVDETIVFGLNEISNESSKIISASICDANAVAHILNFFDKEFGIEKSFITTLHPWLSYQKLLDSPLPKGSPWDNYALGRSSVNALILKETSLTSAISKVLPKLDGRIDSISFRVPTDIVSCADMTILVKNDVNIEEVRNKLESFIEGSAVLGGNSENLSSLDFKKNLNSATIDFNYLKKLGDNMFKLIAWYDNEWAYSARVIDIIKKYSE